jgi:hypothetical protein
MSVFASRNFVSWVMVILFPVSRLAVHRGSAMVHRNGGERGRAVALSASVPEQAPSRVSQGAALNGLRYRDCETVSRLPQDFSRICECSVYWSS